MDTVMTMLLIFIVLAACIGGLAVIQKREKEKEALRQQIAKFKYRANQASTILSNVEMLPVGTETRQIVLQYILGYLNAIQKLSPHDLSANNNIQSVKKALEKPQSPVDSQSLVIPNNPQELKLQINRLTNLAKFISKLKTSPAVTSTLIPISIQKIMSLVSESKICAYIQQGKNALSEHKYVPAQRLFTLSQDMLDKIPNKNARLTQLQADLQELIKSTPADALNTALDFNEEATPEESEQSGTEDSTDELFGPKKKW
ncbi:hypothetical protein FLL45_19990 [Aliikangiella marina]|uniref:Uncharacterized protein n=1 Tax=Aliikangiella marina TaxID=1712262 RepID=A0A545T2K0_9GAMM|nr:hypothetical protein [Aliikangiella marina]TQV71438.1 hypothetical protein FLL45_19990 [Aliikangiella marina]